MVSSLLVQILNDLIFYAVSADESVTGLFGARKRASSSQSSENWKKKRVEHERGTSEDNNGKDKNKKKKRKDYEWSVCVKEISPEDQGTMCPSFMTIKRAGGL